MSDPVLVDAEVAAALLLAHLEDFFQYSPRVARRTGWEFEIGPNPLQAIVRVPAVRGSGCEPDYYTLELDARSYDTWPVAVVFVEDYAGGWGRARLGSSAFPLFRGSPGAPGGEGVGFEFALHDEYTWPDQHTGQLICFSYNLDYYTSNHSPTENQRWRAGHDRVDATLSRIHTALTSTAYLGPSDRAAAA